MRRNRKLPCGSILFNLYWVKKINSTQIAKLFDVSHQSVLEMLRKEKIPIRTPSESQKGFHNSLKTEFKKGHKVPKEWRKKISFVKGGKPSPMKGKKHTEESKKKNRIAHLGKKLNEKHKNKISVAHKNKFNNKSFRKNFGKRFNLKPNNPEKTLQKLIRKHNIPFNYVGDGKIWFNGKNYSFNPDFLSKNPKHIIEVFGEYWHNLPKTQLRDKERLKTYKKYGYSTLIIWSRELLNEEKVIEKINSFIKQNEKI